MTDEILIKFINDTLSHQEEEEVLEWLNEDPSNMKYFIQLKNLWVSQNIPDTMASSQELEKIRLRIAQEPLAGKNLTVRIKQLLPYAVAACFALAFFLNVSGLFLAGPEKTANVVALETLTVEQKNVVYTEKGVKAAITLPDGSIVNMNSGTRLVFPNKFSGGTREVFVSGEAFFTVVKDSLRPMIVNTNKDFKVEVLGTTFNLRTYDNDDYASVTLYTGKINLRKINKLTKRESSISIEPSQSVLIADKKAPELIRKADIETEKAWKEGYLVFESIPMSEVVKRLERWHGTEFIVKNKSVLNMPVTANFHSESIVQIMELLKFSIGINYEIVDNKVLLK